MFKSLLYIEFNKKYAVSLNYSLFRRKLYVIEGKNLSGYFDTIKPPSLSEFNLDAWPQGHEQHLHPPSSAHKLTRIE